MNKQHTLSRPEGHHSITPGFSVKGAAQVIMFLENAFGGRVVERYDAPHGVAHAEVMIGDSVVMLGEAMPAQGHDAMPASLSYYVDNGDAVDATYKRALANGATSLMEPKNQFYGYRSATVKDPGGNRWTICAVIEQLTKAEIAKRMQDMPH
jgi:PhnB protein